MQHQLFDLKCLKFRMIFEFESCIVSIRYFAFRPDKDTDTAPVTYFLFHIVYAKNEFLHADTQ